MTKSEAGTEIICSTEQNIRITPEHLYEHIKLYMKILQLEWLIQPVKPWEMKPESAGGVVLY